MVAGRARASARDTRHTLASPLRGGPAPECRAESRPRRPSDGASAEAGGERHRTELKSDFHLWTAPSLRRGNSLRSRGEKGPCLFIWLPTGRKSTGCSPVKRWLASAQWLSGDYRSKPYARRPRPGELNYHGRRRRRPGFNLKHKSRPMFQRASRRAAPAAKRARSVKVTLRPALGALHPSSLASSPAIRSGPRPGAPARAAGRNKSCRRTRRPPFIRPLRSSEASPAARSLCDT